MVMPEGHGHFRLGKIGNGSIWWGERPREPNRMGLSGSSGASPHRIVRDRYMLSYLDTR
jgi:hypothetical protein